LISTNQRGDCLRPALMREQWSKRKHCRVQQGDDMPDGLADLAKVDLSVKAG
jgi:hypothetical protein